MGEGESSSVGRRIQPLWKLRKTGLAVPSPVGRERVRVRVILFEIRVVSGTCFCTNPYSEQIGNGDADCRDAGALERIVRTKLETIAVTSILGLAIHLDPSLRRQHDPILFHPGFGVELMGSAAASAAVRRALAPNTSVHERTKP